jgi:hypothetical protein
MSILDILIEPAPLRAALRRQIRFPGICKFAAKAKVTRIHAYRVLAGERRSPRLEKMWASFQSHRAA